MRVLGCLIIPFLLIACAPASDSPADGAQRDAGCVGDPATWAALTTGPIPCTKNSDCCVISNSCTESRHVVAAANVTAASAAWPYCQDLCDGCIAPVGVDLYCIDGACLGFPYADGGWFQESACGLDAPPPAPDPDGGALDPDAGRLHFGCGP
jgi:hypothetical protein